MNRFSPKSWGKGFKAFIGMAVILVLLVALFGRGLDDVTSNTTGMHELYARGQGTYNQATASKAADMVAPDGAPAAPMPAPELPSTDSNGSDGLAGSAYAGTSNSVDVQFSEDVGSMLPANRKIINEGSVRIETKDFDKSISAIDRLIAESGGFAESRNVQGNSMYSSDLRYATIVFRVPADKFNDIMNNMNAVGTVTQSNTNGTDITDQYVDSQTRLDTLKVQEKTLLDIMAKAQKLEDVITLESRISEVQYQIESIQNQLTNYDRLVQYSRISANIQEVVKVTDIKPVPRTLGDKIREAFNDAIQAFTDGLESAALWLVANWILFAFFIVIVIVFVIVRMSIRKRKRAAASAVPAEKEKEQKNSKDE